MRNPVEKMKIQETSQLRMKMLTATIPRTARMMLMAKTPMKLRKILTKEQKKTMTRKNVSAIVHRLALSELNNISLNTTVTDGQIL